jgi:hypothetical protein
MKKAKFKVFEWIDMNNPDDFVGFGIMVRINGTWMMANHGDKYIWATRAEANEVGKDFLRNMPIDI